MVTVELYSDMDELLAEFVTEQYYDDWNTVVLWRGLYFAYDDCRITEGNQTVVQMRQVRMHQYADADMAQIISRGSQGDK